jgi:hypothetical protein
VRSEMVRAIGTHGCPAAAQALRQAMLDPDPDVRAAARPGETTAGSKRCRCCRRWLPEMRTSTCAWPP